MTPQAQQELRRIAPRLIRAQSYLAPLTKSINLNTPPAEYGLYVKRNQFQKPVLKIAANIIAAWHKEEVLCANPQYKNRYCISPIGLALIRRLTANVSQKSATAQINGFRAQHQTQRRETLDDNSTITRNITQTPLDWLRAHAKQGKITITDVEFDAGERLREDFEVANQTANMTIDWNRPIAAAKKSYKKQSDPPLKAAQAHQRYQDALEFAGPGLSDVLQQICCELRGLEECETGFGWPRRSGKMMLKLGLARLTLFYGLQSIRAASASLRMR